MKTKQYVCGLDAAVDVIGGKWKVLILWALSKESRRFGELKRLIPGVSDKVLTQHLREMEADEVVYRETFDEVPPRVEYSLTQFGTSLNEALAPLGQWGTQHMERLEARPSNVVGEASSGAAAGANGSPALDDCQARSA